MYRELKDGEARILTIEIIIQNVKMFIIIITVIFYISRFNIYDLNRVFIRYSIGVASFIKHMQVESYKYQQSYTKLLRNQQG